MPKNILIFSDGTGQAGGISVDENRSNIYKLYRATRVGPDSCINPSEQIAYYDAGLGSKPPSGGSIATAYRWAYNFISQATGFGLTANIIDCYEFIIRFWRPGDGDRIYLFGFSRGAYTIRCLASVLTLCGVPTRLENGDRLKRDSLTARRIAKVAVKKVYQHTTSKHYASASLRDKELLDQRTQLAQKFRERYGANEDDACPYFIGVFDTVAAIANPDASFMLFAVGLVVLMSASLLLSLWTFSFFAWMSLLAMVAFIVIIVAYFVTHAKSEIGLPRTPAWRLFHFSDPRLRDFSLADKIPYAKHAVSIDENRADFQRVGWGTRGAHRPERDAQGHKTFEQVWFAGNHSDIGGSYPENESRLSDIALGWMIEAATHIEHPIKLDRSVLRLYPSSDGMQHDECKVGIKFVTRVTGKTWKMAMRDLPDPQVELHPSVGERFNLPEVLQYDVMSPYRPATLANHKDYKDHPDYAKLHSPASS
jgi:uncharacterized protein (DUF2235 family)